MRSAMNSQGDLLRTYIAELTARLVGNATAVSNFLNYGSQSNG